MNKKFVIPLVIVCLLLIGGVVYLAVSLNSQKQANGSRMWAKRRTLTICGN